jgi:carboxyl-terminal processing protease
MIKEKDLKNHLDAEPDAEAEESETEPGRSDEESVLDPPSLKRFSAKHSPLDRDALLSDNQVLRSLDILISYDIFKKLNNG